MLKKLLTLALLFPAVSSHAIDFTFGDFDDAKETCTLTGWSGSQPGSDELLELPVTTYVSGINYKVTKIAAGALDNLTQVRQIKISSYVQQIGNATASVIGDCQNFRNCPELRQILVSTLNPAFTSILDGILVNKQIHTVIRVPECYTPAGGSTVLRLPDGIYSICEGAFSGNDRLISLGLPSSIMNISRNGGFNDMPTLREFVFNGGIESDYFSIEDKVLYDKNKTSIISYPPMRPGTEFTPPATVKKLAHRSVANTKFLETMNFDGIEEIGKEAFAGSSIKTFSLPYSNITLGEGAVSGSQLTSIFLPRKIEVPKNFARDCNELKTVTMLDIGSEIGDNAFMNCRKLTFFNFSVDKVMTGDSIFAGSGLKEVRFAAGVSPAEGLDLGNAMFANCPDLEIIDMSTIVTRSGTTGVAIGLELASGCPKLKTVLFPKMSYFWASMTQEHPCFGTNPALEKIVIGAFTLTNSNGAPLYYNTTHTSPSIYLCTTDAPRAYWPLDKFMRLGDGAVVRPLIYSDNYSLLHPIQGSWEQFIMPNARYYVPGGAYVNYKAATEQGCTVQEMFDINMQQASGNLTIALTSRLGSRIVFKGATVDNDYYALDTNSGSITTTKPYVGSHTIKLEYTVDDVTMTTIYTEELSEGSSVDEIETAPAEQESEYYTLQGVRVDGGMLTPGVYIKRTGNKTEKILVK